MATKKPAPPKKPIADALDTFCEIANADPRQALIAVIWKLRHNLADLSVQIREKDLEGLKACAAYLDVTPTLHIFRRPAIPARAAQAATAEFPKGVPGFPGAPAAEYVAINITDGGKNNDTFRPIENNEEDAQAAERAENLRLIRERTPGLAQMVSDAAAGGTFSQELVMELAANAMTLARAGR